MVHFDGFARGNCSLEVILKVIDMAPINTETAQRARSSYKLLDRRLHNGNLPFISEKSLSLEERKQAHKNKQGRNQIFCHRDDVAVLIEKELERMDGGGSLITRSALKMTDQAIVAAEILDKATEVVENQLTKFNRVADAALDETKKRVSQLNDYNNRLTTSLANLNKTLGDEKMVRALENADRISKALSLLDELEKKGSLQKIMDAMK